MNVLIQAILTSQRMLKEPNCRSITFQTSELDSDQKDRLEGLHNQHVTILASDSGVDDQMTALVEEYQHDPTEKYSPSQRLRYEIMGLAVEEDHLEPKVFYEQEMEKIIKHYKSKRNGRSK